MTESVYVNKDRSKVVDESSPEAAYKVHRKEAERLGLIRKDAPKAEPKAPAVPRRARASKPKE